MKQGIQEQNQRENRLEASMMAYDRQLGEMLNSKADLEKELN